MKYFYDPESSKPFKLRILEFGHGCVFSFEDNESRAEFVTNYLRGKLNNGKG